MIHCKIYNKFSSNILIFRLASVQDKATEHNASEDIHGRQHAGR